MVCGIGDAVPVDDVALCVLAVMDPSSVSSETVRVP